MKTAVISDVKVVVVFSFANNMLNVLVLVFVGVATRNVFVAKCTEVEQFVVVNDVEPAAGHGCLRLGRTRNGSWKMLRNIINTFLNILTIFGIFTVFTVFIVFTVFTN